MVRPQRFEVRTVFFLIAVTSCMASSALIPRRDSTRANQPICDRLKVVCEAGWHCQAGYLFFPVPADVKNCRSDDLFDPDCKQTIPTVTEAQVDSLEVFCVREGELDSAEFNHGNAFHKDLSFLQRLRKRSRRSAYQDQCHNDQDCGPQEECRFRTGCSLIKQGECYNGNVCLKRAQPRV